MELVWLWLETGTNTKLTDLTLTFGDNFGYIFKELQFPSKPLKTTGFNQHYPVT